MESKSVTYIEVRSQPGFGYSEASIRPYVRAIGPRAIGVFVFLSSYIGKGHRELSAILMEAQMNVYEWKASLKFLEAAGLVRTYEGEMGEGGKYMIHVLYSPVSGNDFALDPALSGLYKKATGSSYIPKEDPIPDGFNETTSSYGDCFPSEAQQAINPTAGLINSNRFFDRASFKDLLAMRGNLSYEDLSPKEIKRIEKIAASTKLSEETLAELLEDCFEKKNSFGYRVRFVELIRRSEEMKQFSGARKADDPKEMTGTEREIRDISTLGWYDYLKSLQKGHEPAEADAKIVRHIVEDMGLPDQAANALVLFSIQRNDMRLNKVWMERVAATMVRKSINTANEALSYLSETSKRYKATSKKAKPAKEASEDKYRDMPSLEELIKEMAA